MTDFEKMNKIGEDLERARVKRDEIDAQIKSLERRYREAENVTIHNLVHSANMTPEELAELIRKSVGEKLESLSGKENDESEELKDEDY